MNNGKGRALWRVIKRLLRAAAAAYIGRWGQKHGIDLAGGDLGTAINTGLLMATDKAAREYVPEATDYIRRKLGI